MISNFEALTHELSDEEKRLLPILIAGFKRHGYNEPIKSDDVISLINAKLRALNLTQRVTGVRLRKMVNFIRANGIIPLIATSNGYYTSYNPDEIEKQIQSLKDRAAAMLIAAKGLERFLNNMSNE
jgi:hypothetical protein